MCSLLHRSSLFAVLFVVSAGGTVQASRPPAGTYNFFGGPNGVIQVTTTGAFTGKAEEIGAAKTKVVGPYRHETSPVVAFRGQFDASGRAKVTLSSSSPANSKFGSTKRVLNLQFQQTPNPSIEGTAVISDSFDSNVYATFTAHPLARAGKAAGAYTAALVSANGSERTPKGTGWMTLTIAANGKIRMRGKTGDGQPFTMASGLREDFQFWFSRSLSHFIAYSSQNTSYPALLLEDTLKGPVQLMTTETSSQIAGSLSWVHEEEQTSIVGGEFQTLNKSFSTDVEVQGSMYSVPSRGTFAFRTDPEVPAGDSLEVQVEFRLGEIEAAPATTFSLLMTKGKNQVTDISSPIERLKLNLVSTPALANTAGTFTGILTLPGETEPRRISGVLLQDENIAIGLFEGPAAAPEETGSIRMFPL